MQPDENVYIFQVNDLLLRVCDSRMINSLFPIFAAKWEVLYKTVFKLKLDFLAYKTMTMENNITKMDQMDGVLFPILNKAKIKNSIFEIERVLEPFIQKMEYHKNEFKTMYNDTWQNISAPNIIARGEEEAYFNKTQHKQIRTIHILANRKKIVDIFSLEMFEYSSNNCQKIKQPGSRDSVSVPEYKIMILLTLQY